jgi:cell division initiation protein
MHPKITAVEIQKQEFPRKRKGFDPESVQSFLLSVSDDFEELVRANGELASRVQRLEEENFDHREREKILKETLLSAQRLSEELKANARREAEMIVREAELAGDRITGQALSRAGDIEKAIRDMKLQRTNFRMKLHTMIEMFQSVLDFDKEEDEAQAPVSYLVRPTENPKAG